MFEALLAVKQALGDVGNVFTLNLVAVVKRSLLFLAGGIESGCDFKSNCTIAPQFIGGPARQDVIFGSDQSLSARQYKKIFRLADRKFACGSAVTLLKLFVCGLSLKPIGTFGGRQRGANVNDWPREYIIAINRHF